MRIFWAFNNKWLIENEIPELIKRGYSVYIPKIPVLSSDSIVTYKFDNQLGLPKDVLDGLNNHDFFSQITKRSTIDIISTYFDVVIMDYNHYLLQSLVLFYTNKIILRPMEYTDKFNLTERLKDDLGFWVLKEIEKMKDRFVVSLYCGKSQNKNDVISKEYGMQYPYILPVINEEISTNKERDILFICPEIKTNETNYENYKKFEKEFKNFSYDIIGKQLIPVINNSRVTNLKPDDKYIDYLKNYKVLFYIPGNEKDIPHFLFDAFCIGLPVVFLRGGVMDIFNTMSFTGRCDNLEEAKRICNKILTAHGDRLANKIAKEQKNLLNRLNEKNAVLWDEFEAYVEKTTKTIEKRNKKLAVIMPREYTGGVLDYTFRLIYALKRGAQLKGNDFEIVFGHLQHEAFEKKDFFKDLRDMSIPIRSFRWDEMDRERINEALQIQGYCFNDLNERYVTVNDDITFFEDCDCLLFTADRIGCELYTTVPYGMILHDYIQRYIPRIMGNISDKCFMETARRSISNFTTTHVVKKDSIQYAGIEEHRTQLIPLFFGKIDEIKEDPKWMNDIGDYFIWSTNPSAHKNHLFALNALIKYYEDGGSIKCIITGADTDKFTKPSGDPYIDEVRNIIRQNKVLRKNLIILGNMPKKSYLKTLKKAKFFFHPGCADNGNGTAFDAAVLGVPTLSCDYPAMRNMDEKTKMNMQFFELNDVNGLVDLLFKQEKRKEKWNMPTRQELEKFIVTDDKLCTEIYEIFYQYMPI